MALNFPSAPVNGQVFTDANNITWYFDGTKWDPAETKAFKIFNGIKLGLGANYNLTDLPLKLSFDSVILNTGNYYSEAEPYKVNIGTTAYYRINFSTITSAIGSSFTITIMRNGEYTLSTTTLAPNQFTNFDEVLHLHEGDYLEILVSESSSTGALQDSTVLEVINLGGSASVAINAAEAFSGVRSALSSSYATTTTQAALEWTGVVFDENADSAGSSYWTEISGSKFTVKTSAYYRIKGVVVTSYTSSYTINLNKNTSTNIASISVGPNNTVQLDELLYLNADDYIEIFVSDADNSGSITTSSYLELVRLGA